MFNLSFEARYICNEVLIGALINLYLQIDMVEIKELYKATHEVTLADDIRKHYTGDAKNILLALIKGIPFLCIERKYII